MSVELKNNQFFSYLIILLSLFILILFTKNSIFSVQSNLSLKEKLNNELSEVREQQDNLKKIALEVEQKDSVTKRFLKNEIIDNKKEYLYSEDKLLEYFYNYSEVVNASSSWSLYINSINISDEVENELGFLEKTIWVNAKVSDEQTMKAFLDYLIADTSKYRFFIENYYYPFDGREGSFNMNLPLKIFYR